ncbi:GntR family transcriptional regulator [Clostridium magnum]|uniref:DNA-binding transcriptional repressor LldR n=1 Tax=Clostridium magnum DSM 2767 TaxID=1121326 RepID=A0A162R124_9CLOT|nr:GntR family transcriptional regulator [Clostridium magnum]KZL89263.1 DNA-binding transcriptional repressor LldR [Clostridium magnum DSM 2767]SHI97016.1 regulatory protein, gntR family [Clostridium magnum DSM 2767]
MNSIKKSTLRNEVSRKIRELIFNNELKRGERIVETRIAKELGVSQSPVREAIRKLELMGLIENKPFLGCFVKKLTKKI